MTTVPDRPKPSSLNLHACIVEPFAAFMAFLLVFQTIAAAQSPVAQSPVAQSPVVQSPMVLERKANPLGLMETSPNTAMATTSIPSGPSAAPVRIVSRGVGDEIFQANAVTAKSIPANCLFQGSSFIIQYVCTGNRLTSGSAPDSGLISAIQQFESDSIKQWLQLFSLSSTDADVASFYQLGRSSVRNSVRAIMLLRLLDIPFRLQNPSNNVTGNEKTVYSWFQGRVQARIVQMDQDAVNDKNSWQNNRCTWQPDPDLEKAYGFYYIPCIGTQVFDTAPNADYFTAAAYKKDFSQMIAALVPKNAPVLPHAAGSHVAARTSSSSGTKTSTAQAIIQGESESMTQLLGIIGGSTAGFFGVAGITMGTLAMTVPAIRSKILPNRSRTERLKARRLNVQKGNEKVKDIEEEVKENAEDADTEAIEGGDAGLQSSATDVSTAVNVAEDTLELDTIGEEDTEIIAESSAGGPVGLAIGIAIAVITTIVTIIIDEAVSEQSLGSLDSTLNNDSNNAPNLFNLFQKDPGQEQILDCWAEITWPDAATGADLPLVGANDPMVISYPQNQPNNFQADALTYVDWGGAKVSPVAIGGQLLRFSTYQLSPVDIPAGSSGLVTAKDLTPILQYVDWNGDYYWAAREGVAWVVGKRFVSGTDIDCPAGPTGFTQVANITGCVSFVANSLQMLDANGNPQTVLISTRPVISPVNSTISFNTNQTTTTVSVPISGYPVPTVTFDNLPLGMIVNQNVDGKGTLNFTMDGTKVKPGNYVTQIHATNYAQTTTTPVTFNISGPDFEAPPVWDTYPDSYRLPTWTAGLEITQFFHVNSAYSVVFSTNIIMPNGIGLVTPGLGTNTIGFSGIPAPDSLGVAKNNNNQVPYLQACDGQHRCVQINTVFNIVAPPRAQFVIPDSSILLDFPVGQQRSYTLYTKGATTPVSFSTSPHCPFQGPPSWVNMTDNGNGSLTFSGSAPDNNGVDQVNLADVVIHTAGLFDLTCDSNNLQFFLDSNPQIFDPNPTVTAGQNVGFFLHSNVNYNVGDLQLTSPAPPGMQFFPAFNFQPPSVGGSIPAAGVGGQYKLNFQMAAIKGTTSPVNQTVIFTVNEPPSWTGSTQNGGFSFITVNVMSGVNNQYVLQPAGYPTFGVMSITRGDGFIPPGMVLSTGTAIEPNPGTAVLKGNPPASAIGQNFAVRLTADNGVGSPTTLDFKMHIVPPGDVTGDGKVDCTDVTMVKSHLNAKAGTVNYNGAADVNGDGVVNVLDLAFVTAHLAQGTVCH